MRGLAARVHLAAPHCVPQPCPRWRPSRPPAGRLDRLRQPDSPILSLIGKSIPYEVAVGSNGRVWIVSVSVAATAMVAAAVRNSEYLDERAMQVLVERMAAELGERGGAR